MDPQGALGLSLKPRISLSRRLHMRTLIRFLLIASAVACSTQRAAVAPSGDSTPADSHPSTGLSFIEDDYPRALADAKARHVPMFVDAWAPW